MKLLKRIKAFVNEDDFDYFQGYIDPFEFHKTFYFVLTEFQVTDIEIKMKPTFFNQNLVIFIVGLIAAVLSFISLLHGVDIFEIPHITEAGTYFIILVYKLLIISCTKVSNTEVPPQNENQETDAAARVDPRGDGGMIWLPLREILNHALWRSQREAFAQEWDTEIGWNQFFVNQLKTRKICIFACIFTASISIGMNIFAFLSLFYFLETHTPGDGGKRPLLFPFWLHNVDLSASPIYEAFFCFSNICALLYSYNYIFMIQTQIVWVRHITSKADIVIWSIQDLLVDVYPVTSREEKQYFRYLIQRRLRDIVIHHQSMYSLLDDYVVVYKKLLMFEQTCCGPVICLTAYCTAEKLNEGEFNAILALLFIATIVLYFIPSYLCTFLAVKLSSICDACWNIPFWNADPVIRPYMVLIMQRSLRPLPLCAPGFEDVSIQTFSRKITSAYSCFNMLRHANI